MKIKADEYYYVPMKVKPCPICGGTNLTMTDQESYESLVAEHGSSLVYIDCQDCNIRMSFFGSESEDKSFKFMTGRLICKWNNRKEAPNGNKEN